MQACAERDLCPVGVTGDPVSSPTAAAAVWGQELAARLLLLRQAGGRGP